MNTVTIELNPNALAAKFIEFIEDELTSEELREVRERNLRADYIDCCATHDFCDANMVMQDAFQELYPELTLDAIINDDHCIAVWNKAWTLAKIHDFDLDAYDGEQFNYDDQE